MRSLFNMKKNIVMVACLLTVLSSTAFAGPKFVDDFLSKYKPSVVNRKPTPSEMTPDALTSLIRNGEIPMSITDVIDLTLKNNLDIGLDRLTPLSTRIATDSFYRPFEPTLHVNAGVNQSTTPSPSQLSGVPSVSQLSQTYGVAYTQTLQTGTDVGIDFSLNRLSTNNKFATFNPGWTGAVTYSATQHFMKNFGRDINARQFRVAKNNTDISDTQFERQVIDLVTQAEKSYWDLVFTFEDLKVKQRSMEVAQKTLSDNRIQVDAGAMASSDLVQAESEVASRQQQLLDSNFTQVLASDQVKKLVTNGPDPGLVLAKISPTQTVPRPSSGEVLAREDAIRYALDNRPEMREIELQMKNSDIDIQYTKNQLMPSLDVTAAYTQNGLGGPLTQYDSFGSNANVIAVIPGGIGDTLSQIARNQFRGYRFQATLQIPLSNKAAQSDHARAVTDKRTGENRKAATAQAIALEVRNAITQVEMSAARIDAAQTIRVLAERKLDYEQKKFDLGVSPIRFVLEEQRNVTQAQTDEIAALVSYAKAMVDYNHAIGTILKKNNIVLDNNN
jgi:outer membrane protein TolC